MAANGLRLRGHGLLPVRHLLGNCLRWTTGTARAPLPARLATMATTVLRCGLPRRYGAEQRLDRGANFLLNDIPDDRHQASLSRHRLLLAGARYTKWRASAKIG